MDYVAQFHRALFREVYGFLGVDAEKGTVELLTATISFTAYSFARLGG